MSTCCLELLEDSSFGKNFGVRGNFTLLIGHPVAPWVYGS